MARRPSDLAELNRGAEASLGGGAQAPADDAALPQSLVHRLYGHADDLLENFKVIGDLSPDLRC
jgi:hypothetical protein